MFFLPVIVVCLVDGPQSTCRAFQGPLFQSEIECMISLEEGLSQIPDTHYAGGVACVRIREQEET